MQTGNRIFAFKVKVVLIGVAMFQDVEFYSLFPTYAASSQLRVVDSKLYYNKVEQLVRTVTQLCHSSCTITENLQKWLINQ